MSDLDLGEFEAANMRAGGRCFVVRLPFTDEQREKVLRAMEERGDISASAITRVVNEWGRPLAEGQPPRWSISRLAVERHRRRECKCR